MVKISHGQFIWEKCLEIHHKEAMQVIYNSLRTCTEVHRLERETKSLVVCLTWIKSGCHGSLVIDFVDRGLAFAALADEASLMC